MTNKAEVKEVLEDLATTAAFEVSFFSLLAGTDNYEVVLETKKDGTVLTEDEIEYLYTQLVDTGKKVVFMVEYKDCDVFVGPEINLQGIYYHKNSEKYPC